MSSVPRCNVGKLIDVSVGRFTHRGNKDVEAEVRRIKHYDSLRNLSELQFLCLLLGVDTTYFVRVLCIKKKINPSKEKKTKIQMEWVFLEIDVVCVAMMMATV
jgi:hypothetical protein